MGRKVFSLKLCINADDFGLDLGIDETILELHREGIVTSCSVLGEHLKQESGDKLKQTPKLSIGLHVSFTSGRNAFLKNYSSPVQLALYTLSGRSQFSLLEKEINWQLRQLREKTGRTLSHVDTHEHVHILPEIRRALERCCQQEGIHTIRYPREKSLRPSFKARFIDSFMPLDSSDIVFFGISLMGKNFIPRKIEAQLDFLLRSGVEKALWMVHPGCQTNNPRDYAFREKERDTLRECAEMIREKTNLVNMEELE